MKDYLEKYREILFDINSFFNSVKKENDYFPILMVFVVAYVVSEVFEFVLSLPMLSKIQGQKITILMSVLGIFVGIAFSFVFPFIASGINHLGVLIVGGKNRYFNTFKPTAYSMVLSAYYTILGAVLVFIINLMHPIDYSILNSRETSSAFLSTPQFVAGLIVGLIGLVHLIYAEVIGIAKFQSMTKARAFVAVFVIPLALILILMLVFIIGLAGIFAAMNRIAA